MYYHRYPTGQREITGLIRSDQMIGNVSVQISYNCKCLAQKRIGKELAAVASPDISLNIALHEKHPYFILTFSCM